MRLERTSVAQRLARAADRGAKIHQRLDDVPRAVSLHHLHYVLLDIAAHRSRVSVKTGNYAFDIGVHRGSCLSKAIAAIAAEV